MRVPRRLDDDPWFWAGYLLAIFLITAAMAIASIAHGATLKRRCLVSCYRDREPVVCLYDEADRCSGAECRDVEGIRCEPRVKNLGEWNPVTNPSASAARAFWFLNQ